MSASQNDGKSDTSAAQVRGARGLLGWTRGDLAEASGVPVRTLDRFENEEAGPRAATVAAIRTALEAAGVEFTDGDEPGVKLRPARAAAYRPKAEHARQVAASGIPEAPFKKRS